MSVSPGPRLAATFFRPRRLQAAICAFAALLIIVAWQVVVNRSRTERATAVSGAIAQNITRTVALEQYVRRTLEAADLAMRHAAESYDAPLSGQLPDSERIARIAILGGEDRLWGGISIADANGNIVASTMIANAHHANVAEHPAFAVHRSGRYNGLYVSPPRYSKRLRGDFLWLSRRINDAEGRFAGVVAINLPPHRLTQLYSNAEMRPTDLISVIGLDGITRARRAGNVLSSGEQLQGRLVMQMQERAPNGTYRGPNSLTGVVHYFSHRRLPEYDIFVTSGVAEGPILAGVRQRSALYALNAGIFTLLVIFVTSFFVVIINRRQSQLNEVREANRRLNQAQRLGRMGDWSYDRKTDRSNWSEHLMEMYGRTPDQGAPGYRAFLALLDADGRTAFRSALRQAIDSGRPQRCEFVLRLDGMPSYREAMMVPVVENGTVTGFIGTERDVTQERDLEHMRLRLAHASRIGAMNAMASTLAHELNQPLAAAKNYLAGSRRMARQSSDLGLADGLRSAEQQISFAGDIIRRIRATVRGQRSTGETVDLAEAWQVAVMLVTAADQPKGFKVETSFGADAGQAFVDAIQLKQVFINLIRNALTATQGQRRRRVSISSRLAGPNLVEIVVADTGNGFPDGMTDPFSAFSSSTEDGLGLGLSISRTIIEAHQGRIWADREDGLTSIHFTLPIQAEAEEAIAAE